MPQVGPTLSRSPQTVSECHPLLVRETQRCPVTLFRATGHLNAPCQAEPQSHHRIGSASPPTHDGQGRLSVKPHSSHPAKPQHPSHQMARCPAQVPQRSPEFQRDRRGSPPVRPVRGFGWNGAGSCTGFGSRATRWTPARGCAGAVVIRTTQGAAWDLPRSPPGRRPRRRPPSGRPGSQPLAERPPSTRPTAARDSAVRSPRRVGC